MIDTDLSAHAACYQRIAKLEHQVDALIKKFVRVPSSGDVIVPPPPPATQVFGNCGQCGGLLGNPFYWVNSKNICAFCNTAAQAPPQVATFKGSAGDFEVCSIGTKDELERLRKRVEDLEHAMRRADDAICSDPRTSMGYGPGSPEIPALFILRTALSKVGL